MHSLTATVILLLTWTIKQSCAQMCISESVRDFSGAESAHVLSGDLQLLIPTWKLNSNGFIYMWEAIVQGQVSSSAIEFQIFRPNSKMDGVYDLVYGNKINHEQEQTGNRVSITIDRFIEGSLRIPINPGYIIGIHLRNTTDPSFGLQYSNTTTTGNEVDVYHWQGMGSQACTLSLSDPNVGVLRGINPLVSWKFCGLFLWRSAKIEQLFAFHKELNPLICSLSSPTTTPSKPRPVAPKPIFSTTAVVMPHSSISSTSPTLLTSPTPAVETNLTTKLLITIIPIGVVLIVFVLTKTTIILLVIARRFIRRQKTAAPPSLAPSSNTEPVQYDELLSVQYETSTIAIPPSYINDSVINEQLRPVTVIASDTQNSTGNDISNFNDSGTVIHNELSIMEQDHSSSQLYIHAAGSEVLILANNAAYDDDEIPVERNIAYGAIV